MFFHLKKIFLYHTPADSKHIYAARFLEQNKKWFVHKNKKLIHKVYLQNLLQKCIERSDMLNLTLAKNRQEKTKRIFSALLVLLGTLIKENGRID